MAARHTLVVGASRGIGLEWVRQALAAGERVSATVRSEAGAQALRDAGAKPLLVDVADAAGASALAWQIDGEAFDTVVINAGVFGPRLAPLATPAQHDFDTVMRTNVWGAMAVLPQVAPALAPGARVAVLSSKMGSIGARDSGGAWLYRASKAALNSVLKDASIALRGQALCVAFHPGWVRTDMGGSGADLDVGVSVAAMRRTLAALSPAQTGEFFQYDGTPLPW